MVSKKHNVNVSNTPLKMVRDFSEELGVLGGVKAVGSGLISVTLDDRRVLASDSIKPKLAGLVGKRIAVARYFDHWFVRMTRGVQPQ
ncbi:hypothetical protein A7K50_12425 [Dehalobacter sp. MCB1]|uniref:hypothetical protein n=1 Tax=Dehalobacter sp. MCB1 TaxID=1844756 RepID=UPI000E6B674E|nr:hypothetical protein [Dehalobacter sp. MCB1]RJE46823.1 hypothetical protein A7K50_12425 [Dehalobacter sp. MCB1]